MKTVYYFILLISVSFFTGCDKDDDSSDITPPTIKLNAPVDGAILLIGSSNGIHFDADFSDNVMLSSYKVDIHFDDGSHSHSSKSESSATVNFEVIRDWGLQGHKNASVHHHDIKIPENVTPGKYHMVVYCLDAAGNQSHIAVNIYLSHDAEEGEEH